MRSFLSKDPEQQLNGPEGEKKNWFDLTEKSLKTSAQSSKNSNALRCFNWRDVSLWSKHISVLENSSDLYSFLLKSHAGRVCISSFRCVTSDVSGPAASHQREKHHRASENTYKQINNVNSPVSSGARKNQRGQRSDRTTADENWGADSSWFHTEPPGSWTNRFRSENKGSTSKKDSHRNTEQIWWKTPISKV